jgi:predicted transcriptional regulator of viral defense system
MAFVALISHLWHIIAMRWDELLKIVGREPIFHSSLLTAGEVNLTDMGRQLSRWVKSGNLIQLRRGIYALSERYQKVPPHPFYIANRLKRASYVSLQSALGYHGLIPEYVPSVTSVTSGRPENLSNSLGAYIFKHIKKPLFFGYKAVDLGDGQSAFIALPEKALLDLVYLTPGADVPDYLRELRLQNTGVLNAELLIEFVARMSSKKLVRASGRIAPLLRDLKKE